MKIVLHDSFTADEGHEPWPGLSDLGELTVHPRTSADQVVERSRGAEVIVTNKVAISAQVMDAIPALRYIGISATGTNVVDLDAARARGIAVTNVPGYSTESVAQLVFAFVLHLTVDVAAHAADVRAGGWARRPDFAYYLRPLRELAGKTLVVVGRGAIGGAVARIASGFGMNVLSAAVPGSPSRGRLPLSEALPQADVVTLHCPLTADTEKMVDDAFLGAMRTDGILINTSRGGLVDQEALVRVLNAERLGGVGLDVLDVEPPAANHPLTDPTATWASRVIVTPHLGWATVEARARLRTEVVTNLRAFLRGERRNRVD